MNRRFSWLRQCVVAACIIAISMTQLRGGDAVDINQPYSATMSKPVLWDGELVFVVTAPYKTKLLRVWVPVPPSDGVQDVRLSEFSTFPVDVKPQIDTEPVFGNRFAYFEFSDPQGAMIIRHRLEVLTHELNWHLDSEKVKPPAVWPEAFEPYLRSENQAVVADERFQKLLSDVLPQRRNPLQDLDAVMSFTDKNFTYSHEKASLKASSLNGLLEYSGHCSDYHGFCAAMGRVMSLPTRVTYGINPFPNASPSHCKLEAYLPPYGWVSFDVSETQKLTKAIRSDGSRTDEEREKLVAAAHDRLIAGFRDSTYILQTRGTDYDLVPKAAGRVAVVRTIYAEADGKALPDPDPSNSTETKFAWMTAHQFTSDVPAPYPFKNTGSLAENR
ncbi:MAG TPA: transglutaminase domain-containing protein [Planctomycetaceae bacterium]|nr:transglutaminase domain-containing protein [Planctomycetaceae bacterium]